MCGCSNRVLLVLMPALYCVISGAELSWWQNAVLYQVYPRSYQDTDRDGIGDLPGIIEHVDYLKDLGIDGIWLNPIYESPFFDFGYDISNYTSIDKTFGTLEDFEALVDKLHKNGLKILIDIVPNHSSSEHPWFQEALKGNEKYMNYYVWHDGVEKPNLTKTPPNNWLSIMGGSAWEWVPERNKYYYHAFLKEQPDLNFRNPQVVEEMKNVFEFWLNKGVDGFRVDAVPFLVEDDTLQNESYIANCVPMDSYDCYRHQMTQNQEGTYHVLAEFYKTIQDFNNTKYPGEKVMVTEAYTDIKTKQYYYEYKGNKTSTMSFNFDLLKANKETNGTIIKNFVDTWTKYLIPGGWSNWVIGNHDQDRIAHKVGVPLSDGMNMLVLLLPGTSFSYYGEELGMDNTFINCFRTQDTMVFRLVGNDCKRYEHVSRDPVRTPMQWNTSSYAGFSEVAPWLNVNPDFYEINVESLKKDTKSHLNIYKRLVRLKKEMMGCQNMTTYAPANGWVFAFKRFGCESDSDSYLVLVNFNSYESTVSLNEFDMPQELIIRAASRLSNKNLGDRISLDNLVLRPKESVVLSTV